MYFVTSKKAGYLLFCMTPSGRGAVGLTDGHQVQLLRRAGDGTWETLREWNAAVLSHTDLLLALGQHDEPEDPKRLLDLIPTSGPA